MSSQRTYARAATRRPQPDDYLKAIADAVHSVGGLFVLDCIASGTVWVDMKTIGAVARASPSTCRPMSTRGGSYHHTHTHNTHTHTIFSAAHLQGSTC